MEDLVSFGIGVTPDLIRTHIARAAARVRFVTEWPLVRRIYLLVASFA